MRTLFFFYNIIQAVQPVAAGKKRITKVNLPDKNELVNSCFYTYRMNIIICDQSLDEDGAKDAIANNQCHSDFRIMGAHFQQHSFDYIMGEGIHSRVSRILTMV